MREEEKNRRRGIEENRKGRGRDRLEREGEIDLERRRV
jgi:hypothetical protein